MLAQILPLLTALLATATATCPQDFEPWYNGVCGYTKVDTNYIFNYSTALQTCTELGSNLPSIHSGRENLQLRNAVSSSTGTDTVLWIGLRCDVKEEALHYTWLDGTPVNFIYFREVQSTDTCGQTYGTIMYDNRNGHDANWVSEPIKAQYGCIACTVSTTFDPICDGQLAKSSSKCLQLFDSPMTWTAAEQKCISIGGHLLSIHSDEEDNFLRRSAIANNFLKGIHIGLSNSDRKGWAWTDGTEVNYTNYAGGNPNDNSGSCTQLSVQDQPGKWTTIDCNTNLPFICEKTGSQVHPSGCPSEKKIFSANDHIYSPSFPIRVEKGACEYIVKSSRPNTRVAIRVESFAAHHCCHKLIIYDGVNGTNALAELSGSVAPGTIITATGGTMRLVWNAKEPGEIEGWHFTIVEI